LKYAHIKLMRSHDCSFLVLLAVVGLACGFVSPKAGATHHRRLHITMEDFKIDSIEILSAPEIFSEKQLLEFTSSYSVDERCVSRFA
jgi:hypothetical protein